MHAGAGAGENAPPQVDVHVPVDSQKPSETSSRRREEAEHKEARARRNDELVKEAFSSAKCVGRTPRRSTRFMTLSEQFRDK